jgi:hypothetical protein
VLPCIPRPRQSIRSLKNSTKEGNGVLEHRIPAYHISGHEERSGHGTVYLSHPTLPLHTIQIYSRANDHTLNWNFIKPMGHILQNRREEFALLLNKWIAECNRSHPRCLDRIRNGCLPTRVIDVGDNEGKTPFLYISSQERGRYLALSYRWGKDSFIRTTKSNTAMLEMRLEMSILPKSFRDAIEITRALGVKYICIDSLCVVQDDMKDWEVESSRMATVYLDAYLVLAASQSESASGVLLDPTYNYSRQYQEIGKIGTGGLSTTWTYARIASKDTTNIRNGRFILIGFATMFLIPRWLKGLGLYKKHSWQDVLFILQETSYSGSARTPVDVNVSEVIWTQTAMINTTASF